MFKNVIQNKFKIVSIVLIIVLLVVVVYFVGFNKQNKGYSFVYLATGEVYIGKLTTFPRLVLTDSYLYQVNKDPSDSNKNNFQIVPLKDALWAPEKLVLQRKNVIFFGPLLETSKIAQTLAGQGK